MNKMIKNFFLLVLVVTIATLLYFIFFGWTTPQNISLNGQVKAEGQWKGLIYYEAEAVERSIARYYYEYCYLPVMHRDDEVDSYLGLNIEYTGNNHYQDTPSNLSSNDVHNINYNVTTAGGMASGTYYDTGWK